MPLVVGASFTWRMPPVGVPVMRVLSVVFPLPGRVTDAGYLSSVRNPPKDLSTVSVTVIWSPALQAGPEGVGVAVGSSAGGVSVGVAPSTAVAVAVTSSTGVDVRKGVG